MARTRLHSYSLTISQRDLVKSDTVIDEACKGLPDIARDKLEPQKKPQ